MSQGGRPYIEIGVQPKSKGFRFRYECEGRSAGSIPGEGSTNENRTFPTVKVHNTGGSDSIVVVSCVTNDDPPKPHPHSLVGKDCQKGVCTVRLRKTNTATFSNLGIQCAKKKEVPKCLKDRQEIRVDPFSTGFEFDQNSIDLSVVRLCFQAFLPDSSGKFTRIVPPIASQPIFDKKSMRDVGICRISKNSCSVKGGDEVFLLCEKVSKDDIEVRFYEESNGFVRWESRGDFGPQDVHRQFAIVFRTPPYHDRSIKKPVTVQVQLKRPSDGETSDPLDFTYIPEDRDPECIEAKRKRKKLYFEFTQDGAMGGMDMGMEPTKQVLREKILTGNRRNRIKEESPDISSQGGFTMPPPMPAMGGSDIDMMAGIPSASTLASLPGQTTGITSTDPAQASMQMAGGGMQVNHMQAGPPQTQFLGVPGAQAAVGQGAPGESAQSLLSELAEGGIPSNNSMENNTSLNSILKFLGDGEHMDSGELEKILTESESGFLDLNNAAPMTMSTGDQMNMHQQMGLNAGRP